jgi:hypothetical protein
MIPTRSVEGNSTRRGEIVHGPPPHGVGGSTPSDGGGGLAQAERESTQADQS